MCGRSSNSIISAKGLPRSFLDINLNSDFHNLYTDSAAGSASICVVFIQGCPFLDCCLWSASFMTTSCSLWPRAQQSFCTGYGSGSALPKKFYRNKSWQLQIKGINVGLAYLEVWCWGTTPEISHNFARNAKLLQEMLHSKILKGHSPTYYCKMFTGPLKLQVPKIDTPYKYFSQVSLN